MEKFEGEDEMLRRYEVHKELRVKFDQLGGLSWKTLLDDIEGEQELRVSDKERRDPFLSLSPPPPLSPLSFPPPSLPSPLPPL